MSSEDDAMSDVEDLLAIAVSESLQDPIVIHDSDTEKEDEDDGVDEEDEYMWDSDESEEVHNITEDNNFGEEDESLADTEYWEEDAAADSWLARNPGGARLLYPKLLIVRPDSEGGKVVTPIRDPTKPCPLMQLPLELRGLIYKHYFQAEDDGGPRKERYKTFPDGRKKGLQRLALSSEDVELKYWLSKDLLQTSRQLRFEALPLFLKSRIFTTDYLKVLPRFVGFLGDEGCAMVRYVDLWEYHDKRSTQARDYCMTLSSLQYFPRLRHLRIVHSRVSAHQPWFDAGDIAVNGMLRAGAKPEMKKEHLASQWPEFDVLKNVHADNFTLAWEGDDAEPLVQFDETAGALLDLRRAMRANFLSGTIQERDPSVVNGSSVQWQDTDDLADKTIPLSNIIRDLQDDKLWGGTIPIHACFPRALPSTGAIMRDCPTCYVQGAHCGYHGVPEHHDHEAHAVQFKQLSYAELVRFAISGNDTVLRVKDEKFDYLRSVVTLQHYLGWPEQPALSRLESLDAAVVAGWEGKNIDKQEIKIWDIVYRALAAFYNPFHVVF